MVAVGDVVKLGEAGVSRFRVLEIDDDTALIETVDLAEGAPGRYPWPARLSELVPADAP